MEAIVKKTILSPFTPSRNSILTFHVAFPINICIGRATNMVVWKKLKQTCKCSQRWPHAQQNVRVHVQDLSVNAFYDWSTKCVSLQIRAPDQIGAKVGKRTIRHGIQFFSLENVSLTIYMIKIKPQLRQSRWTGNIFFFFSWETQKNRSHWMKFSSNRCRNNWNKLLSTFQWLNNGTCYHRIQWS